MDHYPSDSNLGHMHVNTLLPGAGVFVSRSLVYLVLAMCAMAFGWASWAHVDEIVVAKGRVTVSGEPVAITVSEAGLVREVSVKVGDRVEAGSPLIRLDPFDYHAERKLIHTEIETLLAEVDRYLTSEKSATSVLVAIDKECTAVESQCKLISDQLERRRKLRNHPKIHNVVSVDEVQDKAQQVEQVRAQLCRLEVERSRTHREITEQRGLVEHTNARIAERRAKMAELDKRIKRLDVVAPVSGTVVELAMQHPGSVLDTSRPAVVIVPGDQPLAAKVCIANSSMKRIKEGLAARVYLDAFPQEDFGHLNGTLTTVEPDAEATGEYVAWIALTRRELAGSSLIRELKPGLNVEAKVVVDRCSVLDFLLKPFRRLAEPISISS